MANPKFETFQDRFTASAVDTSLWTTGSGVPGVNPYIDGETVVLTASAATGGSGISSAAVYDLTSSEITVELVNPGDITQNLETSFGLCTVSSGGTIGSVFLLFKVGDNISGGSPGMYASYDTGTSGEVRLTTSSYNNELYRFLRFREVSGTVHWDTSPDGISWTSYASVANPFAVTGLYVELSVYNYGTRSASTTGAFANVGVVPLSDKTVSPGMGDN